MEENSILETLINACRIGDVEVLRATLSKDPRFLNKIDKKLGWTLLYRTVMCGHLSSTSYLLSKGADPNIQDYDGKTALYQAVDNTHLKLIKMLLRHKADPNILIKGKK